MARTLTAAMLTAIDNDLVKPALFVAIEFSTGTIRLWSGVGSITFDGNSYTGAGDLLAVSQVEETDDLKAVGMTFSLSGIPSALLTPALSAVEYNRPADMYLGFIDISTGALVADPVKMWGGSVDNANINDSGEMATITISAENELIALDRPKSRRYTSEDQKLRDATDEGFNAVPTLQTAQILWGKGVT